MFACSRMTSASLVTLEWCTIFICAAVCVFWWNALLNFPGGGKCVWKPLWPLCKSQIWEWCHWETLNVIVPAARHSPLMGSGRDWTWICVYVREPERMCVHECEKGFLRVCLHMEASSCKNLPMLLIFSGFKTNSLSHMHAPDVSPAWTSRPPAQACRQWWSWDLLVRLSSQYRWHRSPGSGPSLIGRTQAKIRKHIMILSLTSCFSGCICFDPRPHDVISRLTAHFVTCPTLK